MRGTRAEPPLERLIAALLGRDPSSRYVIGDLREEYRGVRARWPGPAAAAWYVARAAGIVMRVRWERRRTRKASRPRSHSPSVLAGDIVPTELRQAVRSSFRRPAFSTAIVLTVALAVAATTLVFAVVDGVLLAPLPYEDPDRLVAIWERGPMQDGDDPRSAVSPANFLTWQDELRSFDGMASLVAGSATLLGEGEPERVGTMEASASYFEIVGARALVGRLYSEVEDVGNGPAVVVLSEAYWRRRFGADSSVVGRTLTVGTTPTTVLGVLPRRFDFEPTLSFSGVGSRDVWLPPQWGSTAQRMGGRWLQVLARLAPGATLTAARQETSALAARLADAFPDRQRGWGVNIVPLHHDLVGDVRETVLIVFGAVCLVLLVACANVANLLMTRDRKSVV